MRNELLLSAMLPICGMAGEAYGMQPGDAVPAPKEQPNIILFLVDDMGWQDTSLPFWTQRTKYNDTYHTPNMERMATQGKMFTQAYACSIYACQPFYGNECCQASSHQLDPPQEHYP